MMRHNICTPIVIATSQLRWPRDVQIFVWPYVDLHFSYHVVFLLQAIPFEQRVALLRARVQVAREAGGSGCWWLCCCESGCCRCCCCCCCWWWWWWWCCVVVDVGWSKSQWWHMTAPPTKMFIYMRKASSKIELHSLNWHSLSKCAIPKGDFIFQPSIFRGHVSFREGNLLYSYAHIYSISRLLKYHISPIFTVCFTQIRTPPKTNS